MAFVSINQQQLNPLEIDCVLQHVLQYVGATKTANLLKCRLVNHNWNRLATHILKTKQNGATINLNSKNIHIYHAVLLKTALQTLMLKNTDTDTDYVVLRTLDSSLDVSTKSSKTKSEIINAAIDIMGYGNTFDTSFKRPRISIVKITDNDVNLAEPANESNFWKFVKLSSPNLVHLKMRTIPNYVQTLQTLRRLPKENDTGELLRNVSFPKLTRLDYDLQGTYYNEQHVVELIKLVQSSPRLSTFVLRAKYYDTSNEFDRSRHLCKLLLNSLKPSILTGLIIPIYDQLSLNVLGGIHFPNLKTLQIYQHIMVMYSTSFGQFVASNCPLLEDFHIYLLSTRTRIGLPPSDMLTRPFPILPNVLHIGLFAKGCCKPGSNLSLGPLSTTAAILSASCPNTNGLTISLRTAKGLSTYLELNDGQIYLGDFSVVAQRRLAKSYKNVLFSNLNSLYIHKNLKNVVAATQFDDYTQHLITTSTYSSMFPKLKDLIVCLFTKSKYGGAPALTPTWYNHTGLTSLVRMQDVKTHFIRK